jgi:cytochrome c oxidase subunit III
MADVHASPTTHAHTDHQAPVSPGKVAMWLFLATEVMFFTGLIGSYIVLRTGSPETSYSNVYQPHTDLSRLLNTKGIVLTEAGQNHHKVAEIILDAANFSNAYHITPEQAEHMVEGAGHAAVFGVPNDEADKVVASLIAAGAKAEGEDLKTHKWPLPYDTTTDPLSINLTAANTFILICSSLTMVLALSAIQRGDKRMLSLWLLATVLIGSTFLGVQVYEYYQLMVGHHYPPGISKTGHFRPSVSLFASCFFTMTGFHGAHVTGGVVALICIWLGSLMGKFTREQHSVVELIGLYWHFVDLVWIILFTVVYLI